MSACIDVETFHSISKVSGRNSIRAGPSYSALIQNVYPSKSKSFGKVFNLARCPGKSFGLKFIPNQSDLFRFMPKSVSELVQTYLSQSKKSVQSGLMQIG